MSVVIARRFRGPNQSGNGGYSAGAVAAALGLPLGPVEVTLKVPPPLEQPLQVVIGSDGITVVQGDVAVAAARPGLVQVDVPPPVGFAEATDASSRCPWLADHPYPQCFVCGTERSDGLRIFPGPVEGRSVAAAPWIPDGSVAHDGLVHPEVVWASVDCPSLFGYTCFEPWEGMMLLGQFTARIDRVPLVGEPCVVMGWALAHDGRKHDTGAALHTADGELLAVSRALWITLKK